MFLFEYIDKIPQMSQRIIDRSYVGEVLHRIFTSDFTMKVSLIADKGFFYSGNDGKRTPLQGSTVEEAVTNLAFRLSKEFPTSQFATWWTNNFREEDFKQPYVQIN